MSNGSKHTISDLYQMQSLPLDTKIKMTQRRIQEWYDTYDGRVFISFSGGKDSTVLLDIARKIYPDMKGVYFLSGIELPSVTKFATSIPNVEIVHPKKAFIATVKEYGYPVVSKEVSQKASEARANIRKVLGIEPHLLGGGYKTA